MFPVFLDLTGRLVVVIGGGPVGRRKASAVRAAGGQVRLICLEPRPADLADPHIDWRSEAYRPEHLDGAALVFAAGPPDVNRQVVGDARSRGLWVNAASEPGQGDFFLPATVRRGPFVLAISTGGAAPLLARNVRAQLETQFGELFGAWVSLLAEMRPLVRRRIADAQRRRAVLTSFCQSQWLERLRREAIDHVRAAMLAEIEASAQAREDS